MKNIKYYLILLITISCNDKLEQPNPNRLPATEFYKNAEQAQMAIDAVYNSLIVDGAYNRMTPAMNDGRSDEVLSRSPWDVFTTVSNFNLSATSGENSFSWNAYYQLIYRANQVLENVPAIEMDADQKTRILGQAHFLRGLGYFNLTLMYNEVPIITKVPVVNEDYYPATATKEEIWQQIISDFGKAKEMLPASYLSVTGPDKNQKGRATKGVATAMLGKVRLYRKEFQLAASEFEEVFALKQYNLSPNYKDNFTDNPSIENSNPETIFSVEFTTSNAPGFNWGGDPDATWRQFLAVSPTYGPPGKGFFDFHPSAWLYQEMRKEKTTEGKLDPRYSATILSYEPQLGDTTAYINEKRDPIGWTALGYKKGDFFIKKYTNADLGKQDENSFTSGINYNVIRLADVYLMYAECQNELNNRGLAAEYIQKVRDRAKLPDRQAEFAALSQSQMRDQISHERVMELAIEGIRIYDIIRWGWLSDPAKLDELKSHDPEFSNYKAGKEYLKVPQGELDLNKNLKPNSAN